MNIAKISFLILSLSCLSIQAQGKSTNPYLFDQLRKPSYRQSFFKMFNGERHLDPWLTLYIKNRYGVDIPAVIVKIGHKRFELQRVCEPHNCCGKLFYILFSPKGARAWGLFITDDGTSRFFGKPDENIKSALISHGQ